MLEAREEIPQAEQSVEKAPYLIRKRTAHRSLIKEGREDGVVGGKLGALGCSLLKLKPDSPQSGERRGSLLGATGQGGKLSDSVGAFQARRVFPHPVWVCVVRGRLKSPGGLVCSHAGWRGGQAC